MTTKCTAETGTPSLVSTLLVSSTARPFNAWTAIVLPRNWPPTEIAEPGGTTISSSAGPPELPGASTRNRATPAASAARSEVHWPSSMSTDPLIRSGSASTPLATGTIFTCSPAAVK